MPTMIFIKCPFCNDEVQINAYSLHVNGTFKGKKIYKTGTCYMLQKRKGENKIG